MAAKIKRAKTELEEIHRRQQALVETLIANYHTLLRQIDDGGPVQAGQAKAAELSGEVVQALAGLDDGADVTEAARRLNGRVVGVLVALTGAVRAQTGAVSAAVDGLGGFTQQYEQIEEGGAGPGRA